MSLASGLSLSPQFSPLMSEALVCLSGERGGVTRMETGGHVGDVGED